MPWFGIPEFLKKRACRYLLQHYLGQFLEEKISLEDLTVDLYNGTGSIHNIPLNVEAINDSLKWVGAPVQVLAGFIECVTVSVPWAALLKDNCKVELAGLTLTVAPHASFKMEEYMSMTDSLFFSMTSSRQMAEEVLREGQGTGETGGDAATGFEGMETLARAIELVLARVQVCLKDTVIQVNYDGGSLQSHSLKNFLRFRIKRIEFYDEVSQVESSVDSPEVETPPPPMDYAVKLVHLLDLSIELGSSTANVENNESNLGGSEVESVPIAVAGGKLTVTVTIKQSDQMPGPKLSVEGFLGSLHVLLSPQQLGSLLQLAKEVAAQTSSSGRQRGRPEKLSPGQSRPIPRLERSALESQLAQHQHQEKEAKSRLHRKQRDLLTSDPWDDPVPPPGLAGTSTDPFVPMTDSAGNDQFYSLDLNSSYASSTMASSMNESFISGSDRLGDQSDQPRRDHHLQKPPFASKGQTGGVWQGGRGIVHRHGLEVDDDFQLHEGLGLQQLSGPSRATHDPFDPPKTAFAPQKSPSSKPRPSSLNKRDDSASFPPHESRFSSLSKYSLTLNGATLALLEANPAHTYTTKLGSQSSLPSLESPPTSMDEGGLDPVRYFELVSQWLLEGVNWHSYQQHQKQLAQFLPADHLLVWLSVLRGTVDVEEDQVDYEVTLAGAEMWEHLYHNHTPHINLITRPISMCPIVQLQGDLQHTPPKPCLKLRVHSCSDSSHKKRQHGPVSTLTDVGVALSVVHLNVDPTLVDRLQLLLATPPDSATPSMQRSSMNKMKHSLYMTSSNMQTIQQQRQLVFHQAVQPGFSTSPSSTTLKVKVNGDKLHLSLRFPVPQSNKTQQPPWFRPSLRTEVLYADLVEWQVSSHLHPQALAGEASYSVEAQFRDAHAFLSTSGAQVDKELFLVISSKSTGASSPTASSMEAVSISVEVQPEPDRTLEQRQEDQQGQEVPYMLDLLEQSCYEDRSKKQPLPFSRKRSMFSAKHKGEAGGEEEGGDIHSEERVLPGSVTEMNDFEAHASNTARYLITGRLPEVRLHLPSKHFLETLYNRFCVDLVVWQPASAADVSKANAQSVLYSCMDLLQPAVTNEERFLMCKSALKEEDSDNDDEDDDFRARMDALGYNRDGDSGELSNLALSLTIDEGVVSILPEMLEPASEDGSRSDLFQSALERDLIDITSENKEDAPPTNGDRRCGMAVLDLSGFHGFYVLGYKGDINHHYACGWVQDSTLYHHGNPGCCAEDRCCSVSKAFDLSVCDHLLPILSSRSRDDQPMVGVAMDLQEEKEHSTLTRKVAVTLSNTSLFYHVTPTSLGLQQLGAFFDVKEEEVEGLEMPALVTELHAHIVNCNLEYRPLYLPVVATMVLDSLSLSTSIVAGAPVHVLRMVIDGAYLLLTATEAPPSPPSPYSFSRSSSSPSGSSVCVMEMEWLELTLRHCNTAMLDKEVQKLLCDMSDLSVECSSNVVHFRMCVDSCIALRDLLTYLSARRDLQPRPCDKKDGGKASSWDYFTVPLPSTTTSTTSTASVNLESSSPPSNSTPPLSRHLTRDRTESGEIDDLISDAMEDASPTITRSMRESEESRAGKNFVVPSKMDVQSTGNSLVMDFDSDTDDEDFASSRQSTGKSADLSGLVLQAGGAGGGRRTGSGGDASNLFLDAEDDFCIVDTPTFTRVAPGSKPVVKCLLEDGEHIEVVQDHFSIPDGRVNHLQRPSSFPLPQIQYTLKEMTIVWHLFGGRDFALASSRKKPHRVTGATEAGKMGVASWRQAHGRLRGGYRLDLHGQPWKLGGGPDRDHSVLVEVELDKLRVQHETYPPSCEQVCRVVVLMGEVEVRDKLANSEINKLLYQYTTEAMPRQSHASMVSVKVLYTRPELDAHQEEASVHVSVLPIRLNLDQDTVLFLYNYIQQAGDSAHLLNIFESDVESKPPPVSTGLTEGGSTTSEFNKTGSGSNMSQSVTGDSHLSGPDGEIAADSGAQQVFIRSFKFHPDLPIRIDYEAKGFKTEIGTVAGILLGLSHLNTAEVSLKTLHYKKGLLGWDKVLEYSTDEWLRDITSYQLPLLFKGVGPLNSFSQLVSGLFKFVQLPCQQYQEDGRVIFGLQRGASALTSSTGVAVVELTSQLLEAVQALAQMAYDLVAPSERVPRPLPARHHKSHQPVDFREGFSNAYNVVSTGIGDTASNLITVASKEHQERGTASAVGTVLRHVPGALVQPIILASEATRHVLGGVKNQFVPDARNEAHKKWKALDDSDEPKRSVN